MDDLWENSRLTRRGWTLQEFVFSPRQLYYGRQQIYCTCPKGFKSADDEILRGVPVLHKEVSCTLYCHRLSTVSETVADCQTLLLGWYSLVDQYSQRALTIPSDKLPAISGIASGLYPALGGDYLAGIWTCDLAHGLMWRRGYLGPDSTKSAISPSDTLAPSWPWAAARGVITK